MTFTRLGRMSLLRARVNSVSPKSIKFGRYHLPFPQRSPPYFSTCKGYSSNSEPYSLLEIRKEFQNYRGGQVTLQKDIGSGIAEICVSHSEKKNALTGEMMIQLADIIADLEKWNTGKGLIIHTPDDTFCSGADLAMVQQICNSEGGMRLSILMHDALTRLLALPLLSVALIKGKAIGGGAELSTACDFRLMTPSAEIQFVQARMGVATGWGGGTRLVNLLGPSIAIDLLTSCRKVDAQEAYAMGLANGILDDKTDSMAQAKKWLELRTRGAVEVVRTMKKIVVGATNLMPNESLMQERKLFSGIWGGPAQKEALQKNIKHR